MATLFIFAGLPATGKTTLSRWLAKHLKTAYIRIDTIEQAIKDLCGLQVQGEGYSLSYRIAADNLRLGVNVVVDSCNPLELTRDEWEQVAKNTGAAFVNIETICSDAREHRQRVETRTCDIPGLLLPAWQDVESREYHDWSRPRIVIDTAGRSESECADELLVALSKLSLLPIRIADQTGA
jgi:predicted kinase